MSSTNQDNKSINAPEVPLKDSESKVETPNSIKKASATDEAGLSTASNASSDKGAPSTSDRFGEGFHGRFLTFLGNCIGRLGVVPFLPLPTPYKKIEEGEVGLVYRFGKLQDTTVKKPGRTKVNILTESLHTFDVKSQSTSLGKHTVITNDNKSLEIDSVLHFKIDESNSKALSASREVSDLNQALADLAQEELGRAIAKYDSDKIAKNRAKITEELKSSVSFVEDAKKWGVIIESIRIKDIILPGKKAAEAETKIVLRSRKVDTTQADNAIAPSDTVNAAQQEEQRN